MKYYKDQDGNVFAFEADGSQDRYIKPDYVPMTQEEFDLSMSPPESTRIAAAGSRINAAYENAVRQITAGYPESEIKSWDKQEAEARAWLVNKNAPTPWIDAAATSRNLQKDELVQRIIAKAFVFATIHGQLTGHRQRLEDQIDALGDNPTQEQLDAIQWSTVGGG